MSEATGDTATVPAVGWESSRRGLAISSVGDTSASGGAAAAGAATGEAAIGTAAAGAEEGGGSEGAGAAAAAAGAAAAAAAAGEATAAAAAEAAETTGFGDGAEGPAEGVVVRDLHEREASVGDNARRGGKGKLTFPCVFRALILL